MARLSIISEQGKIKEADIYDYFNELSGLTDFAVNHTSIDKETIDRVLNLVDGNKSKAADMLGIHRSTLWRILKK